MKGLLACLGFGLIATACQRMPPSNYASLTPSARDRVQPFALRPDRDSLLQEVTAQDIRTLSQAHAYTWVVVWAPWCDPWKPSVVQYNQFEQQLRERDLHLVLVDIQYSNKSAEGKRWGFRGNRPGYVLDWRRYGKMAPRRFTQDMLGKRWLSEKEKNAVHYVLDRSGKVIYWTDEFDVPLPTLEKLTLSPQASTK